MESISTGDLFENCTLTLRLYANAVSSIDLHRARQVIHRYGASVLAEQHLFVPRPGSRRTGQGGLPGTPFDVGSMRSGLAVLDAEHVSAGPLATAWLPITFPLGFHGMFVPSA